MKHSVDLDELKNLIKAAPISEIIGRYLPLRKEGSGFSGICPFHSDTRPSLKVNDQKGLFRCFSCDVGGNAITFVQKFTGLTYLETMKELAHQLGAPFDLFSGKNEQKSEKLKMAKRVLDGVMKLYRKLATSSQGSAEFNKFVNSRKLNEATCQKFSLGLAIGESPVAKYLESIPGEEGVFARKVAEEIGLIRENSNQDAFRDRIMFPIWDQFGDVVGFSGRATQDFQKAKYINSKESFVFNKRNLLYGLHLARNKIREQNSVILVEGHMDLVALHQYGFENSCAVMGIGLTDKTLMVLKSFTKEIILALDSDQAGKVAMKRINALCLTQGIFPRYLSFSPHKDPDEFLRNESTLDLHKRIKDAPLFLDLELEELIPKELPSAVEKKIFLLEEIFKVLSPLKENLLAVEKAIYWAKIIGLKSTPEQISEQYFKFLSKIKTPNHSSLPQLRPVVPTEVVEESLSNILSHDKVESSGTPAPERTPVKLLGTGYKIFLQEITRHPECLNTPGMSDLLPKVLQSEVLNFTRWLGKLYYEIDEFEYTSIIMDYLEKEEFSAEIRQVVGSALFHYAPSQLEPKKVAKLVQDLKVRFLLEELREKKLGLKTRYREVDEEGERPKLLQELNEVEREIQQLKNCSSSK